GHRTFRMCWWCWKRWRTGFEFDDPGAEETILLAAREERNLWTRIVERECIALARHIIGYGEMLELFRLEGYGEGVCQSSHSRRKLRREKSVKRGVAVNYSFDGNGPEL